MTAHPSPLPGSPPTPARMPTSPADRRSRPAPLAVGYHADLPPHPVAQADRSAADPSRPPRLTRSKGNHVPFIRAKVSIVRSALLRVSRTTRPSGGQPQRLQQRFEGTGAFIAGL